MFKGLSRLFFFLLCAATVISSCRKEQGCTDKTATNYDASAEENDGSCIYPEVDNLVVPETYTFVDSDGNNTVSFNGQAQRLEMLSEMTTYLKSADTPATIIAAAQLTDMYANNGFSWTDADGLGMTGSTKQLKSKTAASAGMPDETIQNYFEGLMADIAAASATTTADQYDGANGTAGVVQSTTDPAKFYLFDANGIEYTQLIEKQLMGAVFYDQISNWYLAPERMDADNTEAVDATAGQYYTQLEHYWDEAYGYFTTATDFPENGTDRFWGKYSNTTDAVLGSDAILSEAFRRGRAAISDGDLEERDAQIEIINAQLQTVVFAAAIHYLNGATADFADDALRNHQLSEARAFIYCIQFGASPAFDINGVNTLFAQLGENNYTITLQAIAQTKASLAEAGSLTQVADQL